MPGHARPETWRHGRKKSKGPRQSWMPRFERRRKRSRLWSWPAPPWQRIRPNCWDAASGRRKLWTGRRVRSKRHLRPRTPWPGRPRRRSRQRRPGWDSPCKMNPVPAAQAARGPSRPSRQQPVDVAVRKAQTVPEPTQACHGMTPACKYASIADRGDKRSHRPRPVSPSPARPYSQHRPESDRGRGRVAGSPGQGSPEYRATACRGRAHDLALSHRHPPWHRSSAQTRPAARGRRGRRPEGSPVGGRRDAGIATHGRAAGDEHLRAAFSAQPAKRVPDRASPARPGRTDCGRNRVALGHHAGEREGPLASSARGPANGAAGLAGRARRCRYLTSRNLTSYDLTSVHTEDIVLPWMISWDGRQSWLPLASSTPARRAPWCPYTAGGVWARAS